MKELINIFDYINFCHAKVSRVSRQMINLGNIYKPNEKKLISQPKRALEVYKKETNELQFDDNYRKTSHRRTVPMTTAQLRVFRLTHS